MADIYGCHFEYAGVSSRQHGLIIVSMNAERITQLGGERKSVTIFDKKSGKQYFVDEDKSESALSFDMEIITDGERSLSSEERREIERWLFRQHNYCKFYIDKSDSVHGEDYEYIDGELKRNYLNCRFVNPRKIESGGAVIGYSFTLEADSDMFWQDAIKKTYQLNNDSEDSTTVIDVTVDSDINDYTYPTVTINAGSIGGDIIISNNSDDSTRITQFKDVLPSAKIIMSGEMNYIKDPQYYSKFTQRNFVRLLDGINKILIIGDVSSIVFEFQNRRAF